MLQINVFDGLGGDTVIDFARDGVDINFAAEGVTKIQLIAAGKAVDGTMSGNTATFKAGKLGLKPGGYTPKIVVYTADNPEGEPIAGPGEAIEIELHYHA
jgi:hypothetical protein